MAAEWNGAEWNGYLECRQ